MGCCCLHLTHCCCSLGFVIIVPYKFIVVAIFEEVLDCFKVGEESVSSREIVIHQRDWNLEWGGRVVRSSNRSGTKSAASPMLMLALKQLLLVAIVVVLAGAREVSELNKVFGL